MWAPDGESFVTGCLEKTGNLCQWSNNGDLIYDWKRSHRIQDLAVSPDGHRLVAADNANHVHVYNFMTQELEYEIDLKRNLGSVSISQDSKTLLINKNDGEAQMLDIETRETIRIFSAGERVGKFIIRASFGGANESFIITGSEGMVPFICSSRSNIWQMARSGFGTRMTGPWWRSSTAMRKGRKEAAVALFHGIPRIHRCLLRGAMISKSGCKYSSQTQTLQMLTTS